VFHRPQSIRVARAFSDPPMNLVEGQRAPGGITLPSGLVLPVGLPAERTTTGFQALTVGIRASALRVQRRDGDLTLPGSVELAEISGSDTFVHVDTAIGELVAQLPGVHGFTLGEPITLSLDPAQAYVFDARGDLLVAPAVHAGS
jgi:glycerol transport system ATP-binding protein